MSDFTPVYVPVGVPTFHMESAEDAFHRSVKVLRELDPQVTVPDEMLLGIPKLCDYLSGLQPDLLIFQNLTFANGAYMAETLKRYDGPVVLWTLREPVIDGGRLRLNSLTGAYSAANMLRAFDDRPFIYIFGSPEEERTKAALSAAIEASRVRKALKTLRIASIGQTPEGFGFGRALDSEIMNAFGASLLTVEIRELMKKAEAVTDEEAAPYLEKTASLTCGFENTPEKNRIAHAKLYKAYSDYVSQNAVGALASRCWPDFFTEYGTPVCTVLSLLNDDGIASACEADVYGALSMWVGMQLSASPVFFGDPVSLDETENTVTFWHCGAGACSLARRDTGAVVGVHPNRKIGPAMDFGCEAFDDATIFRIGREPDGSFRFFIAEGEALDKPKQFIGTSVVVKTDADCYRMVTESVLEGFEPHYVVIKGRHAETLRALATYLGIPVYEY